MVVSRRCFPASINAASSNKLALNEEGLRWSMTRSYVRLHSRKSPSGFSTLWFSKVTRSESRKGYCL
jgi:hypothetical protein